MAKQTSTQKTQKGKIRYGVIGLGYFAQAAVLPGFKHAKRNSECVALFSEDPKKLKELSHKYNVSICGHYDDYENIIEGEGIDAIYIVLPNHLHCEFTERAAFCKAHILCEKPMALTTQECQSMIYSCEENQVKLMIAYRLHFEKANLKALEIVKGGKLGRPRYFSSSFSFDVNKENIRIQNQTGGGTLYDIGIYCINAARNIFQQEPVEVFASCVGGTDERFLEVEEMASVSLRFPEGQLASFVTSFGAADVSEFRVVGTEGSLRVINAYEFSDSICHELTIGKKTKERTFPKRDQVGPEIQYFSDCILNNQSPEPSGIEGLADVRIIQALYDSANQNRPISLSQQPKVARPTMDQEIHKRAHKKPKLIHADPPH